MSGNKRDRATGLPTGDPVVPSTSVCFRIMVPNSVEHRSAFKGALSELGKAYNWYQEIGVVSDDADVAAQLWRDRIAEAEYFEECDPMLDCGEVANCIETSEPTQSALIAQLTDNPQMQAAIQQIISLQTLPGTTATAGIPMTTAQANAQLNPLTGCDHDEFWAQCEQFTDYLITAGIDTLEQIETYSNAVEGAGFIEMVPMLGTLMDEAQIDQVIEFINWTQESLQEAFVAADTPGNRQLIACALFCAGYDDCIITVERTWGVMNDRLGGILNPSSITSLEDLALAMVTTGTSPTLPLDLWVAFIAGAAKFAGYMGVRGIDQSLNLVLKLAVNDANNDWELLCEDCAPEPICGDVTETADGWTSYGTNTATYHTEDPKGFGRGTANLGRITIRKSMNASNKTVQLVFNEQVSGFVAWGAYSYVYSGLKIMNFANQDTVNFTVNEAAGLTIDIGKNSSNPNDPLSSTARLVSICIEDAP